MRPFLNRLYRLSDCLAALAILFIGLIVVAQIVGRLAGIPVPGAHEAAAFLMAAAIYLSLAYTLAVGGHIRVTLLLNRLGPTARWWAEMWCHAFGIFIIGDLAIFSAILAWESWLGGERSEGLAPIPVFVPQAAMALGVLLLLVRLVDELIQLLQTRAIPQQPASAEASTDTPGGII